MQKKLTLMSMFALVLLAGCNQQPFLQQYMTDLSNGTPGVHQVSDQDILHTIYFYTSGKIAFSRELDSTSTVIDQHGSVTFQNGAKVDTITIPKGTQCIVTNISRQIVLADSSGATADHTVLSVNCGKTQKQEATQDIPFVDDTNGTFGAWIYGGFSIIAGPEKYTVSDYPDNGVMLMVQSKSVQDTTTTNDDVGGATHPNH